MTGSRSIDWSTLSGPHVSRRTLMRIAAASGAMGYAAQLTGATAQPRPRLARQDVKTGGTLRLGMGVSDIPTLDPAQDTTGIIAGELLSNLFSGLVQFDEDLGIIPDLAKDWTVSEDGLVYTFNLRAGLTFHNGDSLTADDLVYTYERTTDPEFASPHASKLSQVQTIEAVDEQTLEITPAHPQRHSSPSRAAGGQGAH